MNPYPSAVTVPPPRRSPDQGVVTLAATAALGGLLFGFDIAIITGAGPFLADHFRLGPVALGWAFSSLLFGCVFGALFAGSVADRAGRRRPLLWIAVLFGATSLLTAVAPTYFVLVLGRILGGVAVGAVSVLAPMYLAEIAPAAVRGRLVALYQLAIVVGILVSYIVNYALHDSGPANWRYMFATGALPAAVFWFLLWRAPDSPRFLVVAGRTEEAHRVLRGWLSGTEAEAEIARIRAGLRPGAGFRALTEPRLRRPLGVSCVLAVLVHASGINTVIDYAPKIFQSAGWSLDVALFSTFGIGLTNLVFTLVSFRLIDRVGRKPLYIAGSLGMFGALCGLAAAAAIDRFSGGLVLALVLCYIAFFAACIGPVFWTILPEIFPNHIRGEALTVPVLTQWIANAVVVLLFPVAFQHAGKFATFASLAAMAALQAWFAWRFVPETKGRTLEEMESVWSSRSP